MLSTNSKTYITVFILSFIILQSCFAKGKVGNEIDAIASQVSENDIQALSTISMDTLRISNETDTGTLYYAGLLWYLNDKTTLAEIAWKRSARTGKKIWRIESTRLVCYVLIKENRYNQIAPFVESVMSPKTIVQDPEIFSYYARSLWSQKDFDSLQKLLKHTPQFSKSIRNRVSVIQAYFHYDMWSAFLKIKDDPRQAEYELSSLFSKYPSLYTDTDLRIYLHQIPDFSDATLSPYLQSLISVRTDSLDSKQTFDLLSDLPIAYFQNYWITFDLLGHTIAQNNKRKKQASTIFQQAREMSTNDLSKAVLTIALAELSYKKHDYKQSKALYEQGISLIPRTLDTYPTHLSALLRKAQWRYLYSIVETDSTNFFPAYISMIQNSTTPEYFTDLLEETLSYLLQNNKKSEIKRLYNIYASQLTGIEQKMELIRWESIIDRLEGKNRSTIDVSIVRDYPRYTSSSAFDYFVNHQGDISKNTFINDWTTKKSLASTTIEDIDLLVTGYIQFGLLKYGYKVALENITQLNTFSIETLSNELYNTGNITQSLTLMRIAVSKNKELLHNSEMMKRLYPTPYLDIIERIVDDPLEKALLMGIMREESSFDNDIASHAQAIGLTQLLLPTAKDIAQRIGFDKPIRLTDPSVNITLGHAYLQYLIYVLDLPLKAIAAYNGGLGNVWKWEKTYDDSNLIVFSDSLPFAETRNYVRKVSSSAMIYGLLYFDVDPNDFQTYLLTKRK